MLNNLAQNRAIAGSFKIDNRDRLHRNWLFTQVER